MTAPDEMPSRDAIAGAVATMLNNPPVPGHNFGRWLEHRIAPDPSSYPDPTEVPNGSDPANPGFGDGPSGSQTYGAGDSPARPNWVDCFKGDPVNCATGNFVEVQADLAAGGVGALRLARTYNAQAAAHATRAGRFGYGWADPYGARLVIASADNSATVTMADGSTVPFYDNGDETYEQPPWVQASLAKVGDGSYVYSLPDRSAMQFDSAGRLIGLADANDNVTRLHYDAHGNVTEAVAPGGRAITFDYNTDGTVATATSSAGRSVSYGYDAERDLTSVTDARGKVWHFSYDDGHRLTELENPRGGQTHNTYDDQDRVTAQTDPLDHQTTWDYGSDTTTVTDPTGSVTETTFAHGLPTRIVTAKGATADATKSIAYDDALNPITVTDGRGHDWHYTYDDDGNRTTATDPLGHTTTWSYDAQHDLILQALPSGLLTGYVRDPHGNATAITHAHGTASPQTTTLHYDSSGNLTYRTDPHGQSWTYAYNSHGDLTSKTSPLGHQTSYTHDDDGLVTGTVSARGHASGANPADFTTTYQLDGAGRPTKITDPLGHDTLLAYDGNGNLASATDRDGHETQTTYDAADRPTSVQRPDGSTLHTAYDDAGRVVSQADVAGHQTTYTRDAQGRVTASSDPDDRTTHYTYDDNGNRTTRTDPDGRTTTYTYDTANELTAIDYASGHPGHVSIAYTADGLRSTMTDDTGTSSYSYDPLDRLTATSNGQRQTVGYDYDSLNRLVAIHYPDALVSGPAGQTPSTVSTGAVTRTYDDDGRLTDVHDWLGHTTHFAYNDNNALTSITRPDATTATQGVDHDDRLTAIDDGGSHYGYSADYTHTDEGLLASATETGDGAAPDATYSHDTNSRLTSSGTANQSYTYDDADNPTTLTDGTDTRKQTFDDANQLTAITNDAGDPLADLDFDAEGDRTALTPTTGTATGYSYDQALELTQYDGPDSSASSTITQTYGYNGTGLRQYTQTSGTRTYETWDQSAGLPLMLEDGATSYLYGPGDTPIEQITAAGQARYYHHDQLGSTRALTDQDGNVLATYSYTPYGTLKASTGSATNPFLFAGQYTDITGLQYLRARYYDPATAQFLTRDPLEAETGQPYAYGSDDPVGFADPSGLSP